MKRGIKNGVSVAVVVMAAVGTAWAVQRFHRPGHLDVIAAQAMDMSQMRPPTGAAPVALAAARIGSVAQTVTYTGTVQAYNVQDIASRIAGQVVTLPVYPGDPVQAGEVVARLDTSQVAPQEAQAAAQARAAGIEERDVSQVQIESKRAALLQAQANLSAMQQSVPDAIAQAQAAQDAVGDAQAGVQSAQAETQYWKTEIAREKTLADAGAVSRQDYQNELAQAQTADAALTQAQAKMHQAQAMTRSAQAKTAQARREATAAAATVRVAGTEIAVAQGQAAQASATASAARAGQAAAQAQSGYAVIESPASGVVTARPIAPGTLVQPGTTLLQIAEINQVRVQANVAVEDMAEIHPGSPVSLTIQGQSSRSIQAHVTSVFPSADPSTRTAVVEAVVPNPDHRLLPGAFVTMKITKDVVPNTLLVPATALVYEGGQAHVWTVGSAAAGLPVGSLTAHEVTVTPGASNGAWTEIQPGPIKAGARIVTHGQAGLSEDDRVIAVTWGANGPTTLPTAAAANAGQALYKCEKCGMTFSAADAKKDNYTDPMDGGKLVQVTRAN